MNRTWSSKVTFCLSHCSTSANQRVSRSHFTHFDHLSFPKRFAIKPSVLVHWDTMRQSAVLPSTRILAIVVRNRTTAVIWTICHAINVTRMETNTALGRSWSPRTLILATLLVHVDLTVTCKYIYVGCHNYECS